MNNMVPDSPFPSFFFPLLSQSLDVPDSMLKHSHDCLFSEFLDFVKPQNVDTERKSDKRWIARDV